MSPVLAMPRPDPAHSVPETPADALKRSDLLSLSAWRRVREQQREQMPAHRRRRTVELGPHMRLMFEDTLTVRWQIQEVLRVERIEDPSAIDEEIARYAHLLPDDTQATATLFIEIPDDTQRRDWLPLLNDAAHDIYLELTGRHPQRLRAVANADLEDGHRGRPSAVHFLRFALPQGLCGALLQNHTAVLGCTHASYRHCCLLPASAAGRLAPEPCDHRIRVHELDQLQSTVKEH